MPEITFHQGMPNDLVQSKYDDPNVPSLIVFDDSMRTVMNDDTAADLFTEGAHHHNISVILHPYRRIKHLRKVHSDFKEQITICDHGKIGLFHLPTLTSKWIRPELLEKYKYSLHTRLYLKK